MNEYSSVKVVVTNGDVETTFEMPMVDIFNMRTDFKEPNIQLTEMKYVTPPTVKELTFGMRPIRDDNGKYMTITRREAGDVVL